MRAVGSSGTNPELLLRKWLRKMGISGWRQQGRGLPGRPDFIFMESRLAVFVDGCFWHGCLQCYRGPKSNRHYWRTKLRDNRARDLRNDQDLAVLGWGVIRLWEHDVQARPQACVKLVLKILTAKRRKPVPYRLVP